MSSPHLKAVVFDIGGVVLHSPFIAIAAYEKELGLPENWINCFIAARNPTGAWQRFERGELGLVDFYTEFGRDLSDVANGNVWYKAYCTKRGITCSESMLAKVGLKVDGRELFGRMMRDGAKYDPVVLDAIHRIRATKRWKVIALTNNFTKHGDATNVPHEELAFLGWDAEGGVAPPALRALFDDFVDSSEVGMRKPEPELYIHACERNGIQPREAVFLDDIRGNLKAGAALGMETIHVSLGESRKAIIELQGKLGIELMDGGEKARL